MNKLVNDRMSETTTKKIRPYTQFRYKLSPEDIWTKTNITSSAGKAPTKNFNWQYIVKSDGS